MRGDMQKRASLCQRSVLSARYDEGGDVRRSGLAQYQRGGVQRGTGGHHVINQHDGFALQLRLAQRLDGQSAAQVV